MQPKEITQLTNRTVHSLSDRYTGCDDRNFKGSNEELEALKADVVTVLQLFYADEVRLTMEELEMLDNFTYWFRDRLNQIK